MPIYAYACSDCGFAKDVLQKMSDPKLTQCPECGQETFEKQVTAAGFQLKGSGWYVTDFRNGDRDSDRGAAGTGNKDRAGKDGDAGQSGEATKSAGGGESAKDSGSSATADTAGSSGAAAAPAASAGTEAG